MGSDFSSYLSTSISFSIRPSVDTFLNISQSPYTPYTPTPRRFKSPNSNTPRRNKFVSADLDKMHKVPVLIEAGVPAVYEFLSCSRVAGWCQVKEEWDGKFSVALFERVYFFLTARFVDVMFAF